MADEVREKPPRTTKEHLAAILDVLICMDASVHRLEERIDRIEGSEAPEEVDSPVPSLP